MPLDERDLDDARRRLYRLPPDTFLDARAALVAGTADPALATVIGKLRKPTVAAWVVNAYVAEHPATIDTLLDLGGALARAQADLDTPTMRKLSVRRRSTAAQLAVDALALCDRAEAGTTLRQQVTATFDAAIADPDVAARLGALQRPEQWSGFGVAPGAAPGLTLIQGSGADDEPPTDGEPPAATEDDHLAEARAAVADAERGAERAQSEQDELTTRQRRLTTRLRTLQNELADVRAELAAARSQTLEAQRRRRAAQSALDRLERRRRR